MIAMVFASALQLRRLQPGLSCNEMPHCRSPPTLRRPWRSFASMTQRSSSWPRQVNGPGGGKSPNLLAPNLRATCLHNNPQKTCGSVVGEDLILDLTLAPPPCAVGVFTGKAGTPGSAFYMGGPTPGQRPTPASQLLLRTGNAAAAAAAGAGKALLPVFEHLANNMIGGDNPALLQELK